MAVHLLTSNPKQLLNAIRAGIDEGKIKTWSYDNDGDFTHTAEQWRYKAWLRPRLDIGELRLNILAPSKATLSVTVYAVYHARFVEMVLSHFDRLLKSGQVSSLPEVGDTVTGS